MTSMLSRAIAAVRVWLGFNATPFGAPMGALGFWLAALVGLAVAAIALVWLTRQIADAAVRSA